MKNLSMMKWFCLVLFAACFSTAMAQEDQSQQPQQNEQHQRPDGNHRGGMMNFKPCPLEGVWQACNVKEEGGQVQMQLIPCLKMVGTNGMYQDITVKVTSDGSKATENGMYMQVNDSTYRRNITACSDTVAAKKYKKEINVALQGKDLMVITYTSNDDKDSYIEIWKRISTTAPISMMRGWGPRGEFSRNRDNQQNNSSGSQNNQRSNKNKNRSRGTNAFQDEMNSAMQNMD